MLTNTTTKAKPISRRVLVAEYFNDATTGGRLICLELECGHWQYREVLPAGFPSTESLTDSTLGCPECAEVVQ